MKTDVQIAQEAKLDFISEVAKKAGFNEESIELYGNYKAKINPKLLKENSKKGKLILVTAINPTPAGEGKTTTSIGLADALSSLGHKTILALREPSLGPVFGVKGGATGGGYSQVIPMEDINLHFTGDFAAVESANNLLAALIDNHIHHGNELKIDPSTITLKRVIDMNDRQLRCIVDGLHGKSNGYPREDGFEIVVASEVMAILCLSKDLKDLKERLSKIVIGYTYDKRPITAKDLNAQGAMCTLLKDAIKPNLVQTLEHTPVLIHGGPFANIAHGCNSIIATNLALNNADYVVTEAGFGADLGAEKFLNIKSRVADLNPNAVVIVATIRALKMHGGVLKSELEKENLEALEKGLDNLLKHIHNIKNVFKLNTLVAINKFPLDTKEEIELVEKFCKKLNVDVVLSSVWENGSKGGIDLANKVIEISKNNTELQFTYNLEDSIDLKIKKLTKEIYGAKDIEFTNSVRKKIETIESLGYGNLPICFAKTQYSFSDNPKKLGYPKDFIINIKDIKLAAGAGFIVVYSGDIMTMPGLPKIPAANNIDIDDSGIITGLF